MLSRDGWGQHPTYSRHIEALTLVRKPRRRLVHVRTPHGWRDCLHTVGPDCVASVPGGERMVSGIFMPLLNSPLWTYGVCYSAEIHLLLLLLIHLGLAPETFWHQLSRARRNRGPIDTSAFNPLFCSGKARRGRKFKHEDSVQIAVTLAREGNQGQDREKELVYLPPLLQILSFIHLILLILSIRKKHKQICKAGKHSPYCFSCLLCWESQIFE